MTNPQGFNKYVQSLIDHKIKLNCLRSSIDKFYNGRVKRYGEEKDGEGGDYEREGGDYER